MKRKKEEVLGGAGEPFLISRQLYKEYEIIKNKN